MEGEVVKSVCNFMLSFLEMSVSPPKLHVIPTKEFKGEKKKSYLLGPLRVSWMVPGIQKLMLWLPSDSMGDWNGEPLLCYQGLKFAFLTRCRCYCSTNHTLNRKGLLFLLLFSS